LCSLTGSGGREKALNRRLTKALSESYGFPIPSFISDVDFPEVSASIFVQRIRMIPFLKEGTLFSLMGWLVAEPSGFCYGMFMTTLR
jgi:hypothetical protein